MSLFCLFCLVATVQLVPATFGHDCGGLLEVLATRRVVHFTEAALSAGGECCLASG